MQVARTATAGVAIALGVTSAGVPVLAAGCGRVGEAPALPEVIVVVDTNLPVPLAAARLRVDLYSDDGTWFDSSDFGRPDPRDWPASFSVYSADDAREHLVWIRLRTYPEGAVDSYQGERFRDVTAPFAPVAAVDAPRLRRDGNDVTPATEPSPLLTVDRLVKVRLRPGDRRRARILMHGACAGTMVRMGPAGVPITADSESCVATPRVREPVLELDSDSELVTPTTSAVSSWLTGVCPAPSPTDERVCVPGGASILGSRENSDYTQDALQLDSAPPRLLGLTPFFVDRDELTVAGLTALVAAGYSGALPEAYDGPLGQPTKTNLNIGCTWSFSAKGRDDYPVTCASYRAARAICQFRGGDILTEAQWEHVATIAGHPQKVRYPWGQELPTCERAIWGRVPLSTKLPSCPLGDGPRPHSEAKDDVSPLGIRDLYGSVSEWVLDDAAAFDSPAWVAAPLVDPHAVDTSGRKLFRGNSWSSDGQRPISRVSLTADEGIAPVGIRCAYPVATRP